MLDANVGVVTRGYDVRHAGAIAQRIDDPARRHRIGCRGQAREGGGAHRTIVARALVAWGRIFGCATRGRMRWIVSSRCWRACAGSKAFLHFHEDGDALFADVRFGEAFERGEVTSKAAQAELVAPITAAAAARPRGRRAV